MVRLQAHDDALTVLQQQTTRLVATLDSLVDKINQMQTTSAIMSMTQQHTQQELQEMQNVNQQQLNRRWSEKNNLVFWCIALGTLIVQLIVPHLPH